MGGSVELRSYKLRGRYHLDSLRTALGFHAALKPTNTQELIHFTPYVQTVIHECAVYLHTRK